MRSDVLGPSRSWSSAADHVRQPRDICGDCSRLIFTHEMARMAPLLRREVDVGYGKVTSVADAVGYVPIFFDRPRWREVAGRRARIGHDGSIAVRGRLRGSLMRFACWAGIGHRTAAKTAPTGSAGRYPMVYPDAVVGRIGTQWTDLPAEARRPRFRPGASP